MSANYFMWSKDSMYSKSAPFHPDTMYPEYPFESISDSREKNDVYRMIREIFIASKMDYANVNTKQWNPLGKYILPGNVVLIKPNMVSHRNTAETDAQRGAECLITHPSLVRCLFDYVYIALKGKGKIVIADAPVQGCIFDKLLKDSGYGELFRYLEGKATENLNIDTADLRDTVFYTENGKQKQCENENKKYRGIVVDLGEDSYFHDIQDKKRFRVTDYAVSDTVAHHADGINEYCVSEAVLNADVIINIPKPKTHRIAGYTAALKNMIGINARKEYLPHYRQGEKKYGGDEYIASNRILKYFNTKGNDVKNWALKHQWDFVMKMANDFSRRTGRILDCKEKDRKKFGMWYGNDTIWRSILDVNHIVYYCNREGSMQKDKQRLALHFGDMIVCGEKEGPLHPSYKKVGGILFSDNPVIFDYCVVKLMGFDFRKFPVLVNALKDGKLVQKDHSKITLSSNADLYNRTVDEIEDHFAFEPASGWKD